MVSILLNISIPDSETSKKISRHIHTHIGDITCIELTLPL